MPYAPLRTLTTLGVLFALAGCSPRSGEDSRDIVIVSDDSSAPMTLRASFDYGGGFTTPVLDVRVRNIAPFTRPAAIVAAGCAHGSWARDFPKGVIRIDVDENPDTASAKTLAEACLTADGAAIAKAVEAQLDFALANLGRVRIADPQRLVLYGSGEAAPVVARYKAKVRGKILAGDPCLVAWPGKGFDAATPTIVLWSLRPIGIGWKRDAEVAFADHRDPSAAAASVSAATVRCEALPRPVLPAQVEVAKGEGDFTTLGRPSGVQVAGRDAFQRFTN